MKAVFRTSMFGFNKEDVAKFIAKQSKQFESKIADMEEEQKAAQRQFEADKENLSKDRVALEDLRERLSTNEETVERILQLRDTITAEKVSFLESFETGIEALQKQEAEIMSLRRKLTVAEAYREKAEKFDQLSSVLSTILMGKETEQISSVPNPEEVGGETGAFAEMNTQKEAALRLSAHVEELLSLLEQLDFKK